MEAANHVVPARLSVAPVLLPPLRVESMPEIDDTGTPI
jgi:hypothetical protein